MAGMYHVVGERFRVACSATDSNYHGKPGTIDDWCPADAEGPVCDTELEAENAWNAMNRKHPDDTLHGLPIDIDK